MNSISNNATKQPDTPPAALYKIFKECPTIPENYMLNSLGIFLSSKFVFKKKVFISLLEDI